MLLSIGLDFPRMLSERSFKRRVIPAPEPGSILREETVYLLAIRSNRMRNSTADMGRMCSILRDAVLVQSTTLNSLGP
jgi:hypothetical protein